ncbi:MAG: hypothetical protein JW871_07750 [Endomicrobiales bacterium]|nr:hypothetical protein [Endomicrobiales bacterium]
MLRKTFFMAVILGLASNPVLCEDLNSIIKNAKSRYADFSKDIQDMTLIQETDMSMLPGSIGSGESNTLKTITYKKGKKYRIESDTMMGKSISIYDGKTFHIIDPFGNVTGEEMEEDKYSDTMLWYEEISKNLKLTGSEKVGSKDCYKVEKNDGDILWIDKKTLTLVKLKTKVIDEKGISQEMTTELSDFKKIKGEWEMPYKIKAFINEKLVSTSKTESIKINQGLSDDMFDINKVKIDKKQQPKGMPGMNTMQNGCPTPEQLKEMQEKYQKMFEENEK